MAGDDRTLGAIVATAAKRLEHAGFDADESRRETALLARELLGWDSAAYLTRLHHPASEPFRAALDAWVERRARREPFAYIAGHREFYGRDFRVTSDVLVPRPETELLVDASLDLVRSGRIPASAAALDIGTGSGCLAITLALELPEARITATDVSRAALALARANAARLGAASRVTFLHEPLTGGAVNTFDLIVSNPPYVPAVDRDGLPSDVRDYEPALALFGGADGLAIIGPLLVSAADALKDDGWLCMEMGFGQADAVRGLLALGPWRDIDVRPDLAGVPRALVARRTGRQP
jgi:release factor glutamine methyltransferase